MDQHNLVCIMAQEGLGFQGREQITVAAAQYGNRGLKETNDTDIKCQPGGPLGSNADLTYFLDCLQVLPSQVLILCLLLLFFFV